MLLVLRVVHLFNIVTLRVPEIIYVRQSTSIKLGMQGIRTNACARARILIAFTADALLNATALVWPKVTI